MARFQRRSRGSKIRRGGGGACVGEPARQDRDEDPERAQPRATPAPNSVPLPASAQLSTGMPRVPMWVRGTGTAPRRDAGRTHVGQGDRDSHGKPDAAADESTSSLLAGEPAEPPGGNYGTKPSPHAARTRSAPQAPR